MYSVLLLNYHLFLTQIAAGDACNITPSKGCVFLILGDSFGVIIAFVEDRI